MGFISAAAYPPVPWPDPKRMELIKAVCRQDVEKVKVRRLLEAVYSTEYRSGRCRHTPDSALLCRIQPLRQAPVSQLLCCMQANLRAGQDVKFRGSYAPLPSCPVSGFLAPSFARNRRFSDFLKFGTVAGCASGGRDGDYSKSSRSSLYR